MSEVNAHFYGFSATTIHSIPTLIWTGAGRDESASWPPQPIQLSYAIGSTPNTQMKAKVYCRQLDDQFLAMREISAELYLRRRSAFNAGRYPAPSPSQQSAREEIRRKLIRDLLDLGYSRKDATQKVADYLSSQAVLHNPDREFGESPDFAVTPDGLAKLGDRYVNSSIGRQHRDNLAITDHAAKIAVARGHGDLPLNINLTLTHNTSHRSLMRAQSPAISGQISDALHHDPPSIPAEQALTAFLTHAQETPPHRPKKLFPPPLPIPRRTPADVQASIRSHLTKLQGARQRPQGMSPPGPQQRHQGLGR